MASDNPLNETIADQPAPKPPLAIDLTQDELAVPPPSKPAGSGSDAVAGQVIDSRYTLVERIGEGGMGTVWSARQTSPIQRDVAIKLIKPGMDSGQVLTRFEAERQVLALMDHPHIARVFDAGLTGDGRPYFVMELVRGVPITDYCDQKKLNPQSRLQLLVEVCHAIQHAHQKGVIHRDIKPSNILVAEYDGKPMPKVIDFGVAKATGGALTDTTLDTAMGGLVGTPQYMSPEQATLNNLDIDTRSDVYSLGVVLYELLTGAPPFEKKDLERRGLLEVLRVVREEDPPRPSTKVSTIGLQPTTALAATIDARKLVGLLRTELDWVVMKALEKDRARRYDSATNLADDLQRYLKGEPVLAHPPSAVYRVRKFARRHRPQVIASGVALLALIVGIIGTTVGFIRASHSADAERIARIDAENQRAAAIKASEAEKAANTAAQRSLKQVVKANDVLASVFESLDPSQIASQSRPLQAILAEKLVAAADQIEGDSLGDPLAVARVQLKLGRSLESLAEPAQAVKILQKSQATLRSTLGPTNLETIDADRAVSLSLHSIGQRDKAVPILEQTHQTLLKEKGPNDPATLAVAFDLANLYWQTGQLDKADQMLQQLYQIKLLLFGNNHRDTFTVRGIHAMVLKDMGKLDRAIPMLEDTLRRTEAHFGPNHPETLNALANLGGVYDKAGQHDKAIPIIQTGLERCRSLLGSDHPMTLTAGGNLGLALNGAGRFQEAVPILEESLRGSRKAFAVDDERTQKVRTGLGMALRGVNQHEKAAPLFEEAAKVGDKIWGPDHTETLGNLHLASVSYILCGKSDKAIPSAEVALSRGRKVYPAGSRQQAGLVEMLARAYRDGGQTAKAIPLLEEWHRIKVQLVGAEHPESAVAARELVKGYLLTNQPAKATSLAGETLAHTRKNLSNPSCQSVQVQLIDDLLRARIYPPVIEALPALIEHMQRADPGNIEIPLAQSLLGNAMLANDQLPDAEKQFLTAYENLKQRDPQQLPPAGKVCLVRTSGALVQLYTASKRPDDAAKWQAIQKSHEAGN